MKTLPSLLPSGLLILLVLITCTPAVAQQAPPAAPASSQTPVGGAGGQRPVASPDGQALARRAIVAVESQRSLYMKLRQRIHMFGQQLVGNGTYQQLYEGDACKLRLDLKVNIANQTTSMQQISDSRFLYVRREFGDSSHLGRVDLRRIREAVDQSDAADGNIDASHQWMLLGGVPHLLSRQEKNFQFTAPREATLETVPVTVIDGYWQPEALLALLPDRAEDVKAGKPIDAKALNGQLPTQIRLIVRTADSFPVRIEYLRAGKSQTADEPPPVTTIMAMEFYDISKGVHIDPLTFSYNPGEQEVADHTDTYLRSLGLKDARQATRERAAPR